MRIIFLTCNLCIYSIFLFNFLIRYVFSLNSDDSCLGLIIDFVSVLNPGHRLLGYVVIFNVRRFMICFYKESWFIIVDYISRSYIIECKCFTSFLIYCISISNINVWKLWINQFCKEIILFKIHTCEIFMEIRLLNVYKIVTKFIFDNDATLY